MATIVNHKLTAVFGSLVLGCYVEERPSAVEASATAVVRDSGGVWIAEQSATSLADWPVCQIDPEPLVAFGLAEGDAAFEFGDVVDVVPWSDGRVVVLDRQSKEIRVFTQDGSYLHSIGRDGEGPGEFRDPIDVVLVAGDTLLVWDWRLQRVTVFDANGARVATIVPSPQPVNVGYQLLTSGGN